jgi:hypothetical protein
MDQILFPKLVCVLGVFIFSEREWVYFCGLNVLSIDLNYVTTVIAKIDNSLALSGWLLLLDRSGVVYGLSLSGQRSHLRNGRRRTS